MKKKKTRFINSLALLLSLLILREYVLSLPAPYYVEPGPTIKRGPQVDYSRKLYLSKATLVVGNWNKTHTAPTRTHTHTHAHTPNLVWLTTHDVAFIYNQSQPTHRVKGRDWGALLFAHTRVLEIESVCVCKDICVCVRIHVCEGTRKALYHIARLLWVKVKLHSCQIVFSALVIPISLSKLLMWSENYVHVKKSIERGKLIAIIHCDSLKNTTAHMLVDLHLPLV